MDEKTCFCQNTPFSVNFIHRSTDCHQSFLMWSLGHSESFAVSISAMPKLSATDRGRLVGMLEAGMSIAQVARFFQCSHRTVRLWQRRFANTGSLNDLPRSGRPRVTTREDDRYIVLSHLRNRFLPASRTAATTRGLHGRMVNRMTIVRRLKERELRARRPFVGPILTPRHRRNRLRWARQRSRWTFRNWGSVLFSDESRFCVSVADGRQRVWRRKNERTSFSH